MWKSSSCSLIWVPVLLIHSTMSLLVSHLWYEFMFILQLELTLILAFLLILCAFQKGHLEVVKFLIENGANGVDRALFDAIGV